MNNQSKVILLASVVAVTVIVYFASSSGLVTPGSLEPTPDSTAALPAPNPSSPSSDNQPIIFKREPLEVMGNPYPDISGIAVDPVRDEIVLVTGQRDAQVMAYDRLADTPLDDAEAIPHEPKRMIGGSKSKIGAPGLYVDPDTGEIYTVDTTHGMYEGSGNRMVVFSHSATGNLAPDRELLIPHRGFAIAADEQADELFITVQHPPAVIVYPKTAKDTEAPLRILEGPRTQLTDVHGIALDTKNKLMYVANRGSSSSFQEGREWSEIPIEQQGVTRTWDIPEAVDQYLNPGSGIFRPASITIYPMDASGDASPERTIQGPRTQLGWPAFIALDEERQELYVANSWPHAILVFRATDSGDVAPIRVIKGEVTGLDNPYGMALDKKNGEIVVANYGNYTATVYPQTADGDTPPLRTIRLAPEGSQVPIFQHLSAVEYDSKRDEILMQSCIAQPQMAAFSMGDGDNQLSRILAGQNTLQSRAMHDMRYDPIHDEIVFSNPIGQALLTYHGGASGDDPPLRVIQGPQTQLVYSDYIEVDPVHDELYVPDENKILVFDRTAHGDVAPIRILEGPDTGLDGGGNFMSVDPTNNLIVIPKRNQILIFDRTASGNTKPRAVIESPYIRGVLHLRVYPPSGLIVTILGGKSNGVGQDEMTAVAVWSIHDNGNIPPRFIMIDPVGTVAGRKLAFNPKDKEIIVGGGINVRRYHLPEIYQGGDRPQ